MNPEHAGNRPVLLWMSLSLAPPDPRTADFFAQHYDIRYCQAADLIQGPLPGLGGTAGICFECEWPEAPEMALMSEVKGRHPSVPILLFTSHLTAEVATWALRSRVFDCLSKPLQLNEASACIERLKAARTARRDQNARSTIATSHRPSAARPAALNGSDRVVWVMAEIKRRLASRPTEADMAALCRVSPTHFSRIFRREAGMTFQQFLARTRLELASRLLADSELPIGEIALRVGFDDPAYFARFFRRQTGVTPSDHRSRAREQQTAAGKTAAA